MNKRRFSRPTLFVFVLVGIGIVPTLLLRQVWQQETLDIQLLHAVQAGQPESVQSLLQQGANANMITGSKLSAIDEANAALENVERQIRTSEDRSYYLEELNRRQTIYGRLLEAGARK